MLRLSALVACLSGAATGALGGAERPLLKGRLWEIRQQFPGGEADLPRFEAAALKLLDDFPAPEDHGIIYTTIATEYACKGMTDARAKAAKVAHFCNKALECPLDVLTKIRMFSYLGGSFIRFSMLSTPGGEGKALTDQEFLEARTRAVNAYLTAFRLVLDHQTQRRCEIPPTYVVYHVHAPPDDPIHEETRKKDEAQGKRIEEVKFQNELVLDRKGLVSVIAHTCTVRPYPLDKLEQQARGALRNEEAVQEIMKEVRERRTQIEQAMELAQKQDEILRKEEAVEEATTKSRAGTPTVHGKEHSSHPALTSSRAPVAQGEPRGTAAWLYLAIGLSVAAGLILLGIAVLRMSRKEPRR